MRGWKGAGTDPGAERVAGSDTSGASFMRLTEAANGPGAPMAIQSSPSPRQTSSLPFSSPLPSISTISRSEKGPKTRPDGRRTR